MTAMYCIIYIYYTTTTQYAIGSNPFSGGSPLNGRRLPSSEVTAINPPCGKAKTAQLMRQEIYEVLDGASNETKKITSRTSEPRIPPML